MPGPSVSGKEPQEFHDMFGFKDFAAVPKPEEPYVQKKTPPTSALDNDFKVWKSNPTPATMGRVLKSSSPVIDKAIKSYADTESPLLRSRGRQIVAESIKTYDPSSKASLETWLHSNLRGLARYSQSLSPIRTNERTAYERRHLDKSRQSLIDDLGRSPTEDELSDNSGLSPKRIREILRVSKPVVSESQMVDAEGAPYLPGVKETDPQNIYAEYVYHDLDPVSKRVYDLMLGRETGKPVGVTEAASILRLSPGAISQRAAKISKKLEAYKEVSQ